MDSVTSVRKFQVKSRDACADPGPVDTGTSDSFSPEHLTSDTPHRRAAWSGGVKLRLKHSVVHLANDGRRSEPVGRPHSWHSTKFGDSQPDASMMQISQGMIGTPWPQSYHSRDMYASDFVFPDTICILNSSTSDLSNYDHAYLRRSPDQCSSQGSMESLEPSGGYPPCHLLSPAKSTSSIDQLSHLHNKRDSAYSSFSTSSSILEYPPPGVSGRERSGSLDTISARGGLLEGMRQADIRYVKTVYDPRRGVSAEYEVNSSALLLQARDTRASTDVGAPLPPARSDSYAAFRQRERPGSWSNLDQKRSCRPQANSAGALKSPFMEEQLHTVLEKSPENSPPVRPKHNYTQKAQPGQPLLPTGIYPVPALEPHFAQVPQSSVSSNGTLYPALAKEGGYTTPQGVCDKMAALDENGNQNGSSRPGFAFCQPLEHDSVSPVERRPETSAKCVPYKVHFPSVPENEEETSLKRHLTPLQCDSPLPSERKSSHGNKYSHYHGLQSPQAQAWHNIPESLRRQSSLDLGGGAQDVYLDGRPTCAVNAKAEDSGRKVVPDHRSHLDSSDPGYEEPLSPRPQETWSLGRRRLSSSSASTLQGFQYGKPHCSVLEKVSKIEQREQGSQRPPSSGEQHFKNEEPKSGEASWQPCGQQPRRGPEGGRGPQLRAGEPTRRDTRLLRSQSTFQLFSEADKEAVWRDERPGTPKSPESPVPDAPFSRAYRNSIKDAQSRVLGATSFRRRDLEEATHLPAAAVGGGGEPSRVPRDRSSSFAGGRLLGDRRRGDQAPRELLGGANGGPKGPQRLDRTPGEPSSWGAVAGRAGKSMSAEDLLERSDVRAVPVHMRSRSSPIADKRQDVLLGDSSGFGRVKDPCYLPEPGPRPSDEAPADSLDDFPPPPPQAMFQAQWDSEGYCEPHASSSSKLAKVTVAKERPMPGAAHLVDSQILALASRSQTSIKSSEASEPNSLSATGALPQPAGSLSKQPSPGQPPPIQTQRLVHDPVSGPQGLEKNVSSGPQKTSEDIRTEALAKEIVHQDKSLADILDPDSRMKTTMDLMEGLFPRDTNLMQENSIKKKAMQKIVSFPGCEAKRSEDKEAVGRLVNCPAYYGVSAPKAELLNKIKDMPEEVNEEEEQADVNEKKAELIASLTHKLETLQEAKGSLLMDIKLNNALGEEVGAWIGELCKPNEIDKYKMFIGDLDKVVNLLLSLSGRLARVENVLSGLGEDASDEERSSLNEKRKVLAGQHEDARELKENLDRRERVVLDILANYLSEEQLQDYQHFVKMKSTLLIEQRKLDDRIKLGQEQVKCLLESLPADFVPKAGALALPPDLASDLTPVGGVSC
ncbi:shroom family member 3 [Camelus ferus]|nr:shroom family member 3 [Camelus ferus]